MAKKKLTIKNIEKICKQLFVDEQEYERLVLYNKNKERKFLTIIRKKLK